MKKHKIAYIDERDSEIRSFRRRVHNTLEVLPFLPNPDIDEFIRELLTSDAKAFVVDFRLNEYRTDVEGPISYDGAEVLERILEIRKGFPCFLLTSFDSDAVKSVENVNYIYSKDILKQQIGQISLAEKIRIQIDHYQATIEKNTDRFHELLEKSEKSELNEAEENELLKLDSFLESAINDHDALPAEKKEQLAIGKIEELITSTKVLLASLKEDKDS